VIEAMLIESSPAERERSSALLAAAADPVRWRLLSFLARTGTQCVCELQPEAGVAPNVLSYHLKVLREVGLVTSARRGRWVDYSLAPDAAQLLLSALPTTPSSEAIGHRGATM
jgi:ArsR family transcriptional regulator